MGILDTFRIHNECQGLNAGLHILVRISCHPLRNGGFISKLEGNRGTIWYPPHVALRGASAVPTRFFLA